MGGRGRLVALEVDPERRKKLAETLRRLYGTDHGIETPNEIQDRHLIVS